MPAAIPFIPAIAGVAGSLIGASASNKAAKQQAKGTQAAIDTQNQLIGPFAQAGAEGIPAIQDFVNQGANFSDTQAFKDIVNTQKARGQSLSGNTLTELGDYYTNNFRSQRLNELGFLTGVGANAAAGLASNVGGLQQNLGTIGARGTTGSANALAGGLGAIGGINFSSLVKPNSLLAPQQQPQQQFGTFNTGIGNYRNPLQPFQMPGRS